VAMGGESGSTCAMVDLSRCVWFGATDTKNVVRKEYENANAFNTQH